jgi:hypothetical protein
MPRQRLLASAAFAVSLIFFSAGSVFSQDIPTVGAEKPSSELFNINTPALDPLSIPSLARIMQSGAKVFYLGERSGIYGWFVIKNRQIQMVYVTADKKTVFIGSMFSVDGENVTARQVVDVIKSTPEIKALLEGSAEEEKEIYQAGARPGGSAAVSALPQSTQSSVEDKGAFPVIPVSPGERLVSDLKVAGGVVLGKNDKSEIYIVLAPKCPNCKSTWKELRPAVREGKVQVRLIPVYNSIGEEEKKMAARLLGAKDPMTTWDRFVDGDPSSLAGEPDSTAVRAVMDNLGLVAKWNIQGYPYLVYKAVDGRIKVVQGRPERIAAILTEIAK